MQSQQKQLESNNATTNVKVIQFLTFKLNNARYAINILNIKEIIDYGHITKVPMMPDFIAGVINLRGSVVPVVDLALRFSQPALQRTKRSSIIIMEFHDEALTLEIGVTVDVVNVVIDILSSQIEPTPEFGTKIRTDFISGMGKVDDQLLLLLDMNTILSIDELSHVHSSNDSDFNLDSKRC